MCANGGPRISPRNGIKAAPRRLAALCGQGRGKGDGQRDRTIVRISLATATAPDYSATELHSCCDALVCSGVLSTLPEHGFCHATPPFSSCRRGHGPGSASACRASGGFVSRPRPVLWRAAGSGLGSGSRGPQGRRSGTPSHDEAILPSRTLPPRRTGRPPCGRCRMPIAVPCLRLLLRRDRRSALDSHDRLHSHCLAGACSSKVG